VNTEVSQRRSALVTKINVALTECQLQDLSPRQLQLFENRLARMLDKYQDDEITPDMVLGHYELVTEYTMPSWLEQGMAAERKREQEMLSKDSSSS
jgi:hypothetical protein